MTSISVDHDPPASDQDGDLAIGSPSKAQFYRRFGGWPRVGLYKALLALVTLPRAAAASLAALLRPAWRPPARRFRRLLLDLPRL